MIGRYLWLVTAVDSLAFDQQVAQTPALLMVGQAFCQRQVRCGKWSKHTRRPAMYIGRVLRDDGRLQMGCIEVTSSGDGFLSSHLFTSYLTVHETSLSR